MNYNIAKDVNISVDDDGNVSSDVSSHYHRQQLDDLINRLKETFIITK